jgi:hypothetical protein
MALQLFRLASETFPNISATASATTTMSQAVNAYFRTVSAGGITITASDTFSFVATSWVDENGSAVASFATAQGLNQLFSNGVLQQPSLYTVVAGAVQLTTSATPISIQSGTPLTLQTYNSNAIVGVTISVTVSATSSQVVIP